MSEMDSAEKRLLIPSHWNPHWNYHLGGEPRSICACPDGPYYGAALVGTPPYCERCGGLTHATPPGDLIDHVARLICERHQAGSPTRQPCAACIQDATACVLPPDKN